GSGRLSAWSLADGKPAWRKPLPDGGAWRLLRPGGALLAWKERAAGLRFGFRWLVGSVQWRVGPLPHGQAWSVACLDPGTGNLVQRLDLEPESLPLAREHAWPSAGPTWPAVELDRDDEGAPGPAVVPDRGGLVVAVGNRVKVLGPGGPPPCE